MKRYLIYILSSLLLSLYIYLFYRTQNTVVNQIIISFISFEKFEHIKSFITNSIPLHSYIIYSLPEGLWVFAITLSSKNLYFKFNGQIINCAFIPILYAVFLEFCQLLQITNGQFDWMDILFSLVFWFIAIFGFSTPFPAKHVFKNIDARTLFCFATYAIVYLAHVII